MAENPAVKLDSAVTAQVTAQDQLQPQPQSPREPQALTVEQIAQNYYYLTQQQEAQQK